MEKRKTECTWTTIWIRLKLQEELRDKVNLIKSCKLHFGTEKERSFIFEEKNDTNT